MRELTPEEKSKIEKHKLWLLNEPEGERANFQKHDFRDADLRYADLRDADLRCADLRDANLRDANLRYAKLRDANLRYADLLSANLRDANLSNADLRDANLSDADLSNADLSNAKLIVLQLPIWTAYVQLTHTRIGCKYFKNEQWRAFSDQEISEMAGGALEWWKIQKPLIFTAMDAVTAQEAN